MLVERIALTQQYSTKNNRDCLGYLLAVLSVLCHVVEAATRNLHLVSNTHSSSELMAWA